MQGMLRARVLLLAAHTCEAVGYAQVGERLPHVRLAGTTLVEDSWQMFRALAFAPASDLYCAACKEP